MHVLLPAAQHPPGLVLTGGSSQVVLVGYRLIGRGVTLSMEPGDTTFGIHF